MRRARTLVFTGIIAAVCAQGGAGLTARGWDACQSDWEQLCSGISDQYSVFQCLKREEKRLNPACRNHLSSEHRRIENNARSNCGKDYAQFCWYVVPGDGRIFRCLKSRLDDLSPDCRAQFESLPDINPAR